ncbi:DUF4435 domain-containing protein [Pseudoalteromonas luteoviolacea]|uniref:Uncharacterized protein n=1 Tax=Pseudoalteromonas luteoviolacea H33 TaxID=1365251 RepID=A0A167ELL1_9GAMM|nr:DUF4435 domain-containing protein [Pseudoalteromonas luteoviolacea]KZN50929.1 hypothetical protein N476_14905 [Pseudoalteromonas luteoviolacea H33]KZN75003.1 hypothetical protein N477_20545 [Pseudoalteromonas luteoviolacea H33-S]MBQ4879625.1 DUF4435 domain-containing protein [Pseudoalteromonas luteoviolacea]MBQ4909155.1 DUF4435 domain-containing protein [Pseudoalteromonas luteoviolacea]
MEPKNDISKYITSVKMSSKKRILVEGADDKDHISNLLNVLGKNKIKIDSAERIKGDCKHTSKNNRAKIEKIFNICKDSVKHSNLYYLCDREFKAFNVEEKIVDMMVDHKTDRNLSWTIGHSLENYFIEPDLIANAYRYLTSSEYKNNAAENFKSLLPSALRMIATITLAAREINKCSYPLGVIRWDDFEIIANEVTLNINVWRANENHEILSRFKEAFNKYKPVVESSDISVLSRVCRGHTAMQLLQRIFALCLFQAGSKQDENLAKKAAVDFSKIKEKNVSTALCESWLKTIADGSPNYPSNLILSVS